MVEPATDYVLAAFGQSMMLREDVGRGFPCQSAGFIGGGLSSFDDLEHSVSETVGRSAMAIIYGEGTLPEHRGALMSVYARGKVMPPDEVFLEAVARFERKAQAKGIL